MCAISPHRKFPSGKTHLSETRATLDSVYIAQMVMPPMKQSAISHQGTIICGSKRPTYAKSVTRIVARRQVPRERNIVGGEVRLPSMTGQMSC